MSVMLQKMSEMAPSTSTTLGSMSASFMELMEIMDDMGSPTDRILIQEVNNIMRGPLMEELHEHRCMNIVA
jgi:hypothetical protein